METIKSKEKNQKNEEKVITIKIEDINQLKIILATWYSYLLSKNHSQIEIQTLMKIPVFYNIEKDELELIISGSEHILKELNEYVSHLNNSLRNKK